MKHLIIVLSLLILCLNLNSQQKELERDGIYIIQPDTNFSINFNQKLYILTEEKMQKLLNKDFVSEINYYKSMLVLYEKRVDFLESNNNSVDLTYKQEIKFLQTKFDMETKLRIDFEDRYNKIELKNKVMIFGLNVSISIAIVGIGLATLFGYLAFN